DYLEEQHNEIDVLKSIYPEEFQGIGWVKLQVQLPTDYPDVKPDYKLAEESVGMVMIFSLASVLKDTLEDILGEKMAERKRLDEERVAREIAAEQEKFVGTKVSVETFLVWKHKFDSEMEALRMGQLAGKKSVDKKNKLTGRQLFEKDSSLARSDVTLMDDGDTAVDPTLFEKQATIHDDDDDEGVRSENEEE
ncbi:hypothetical protein BJ085DRAFT_20781, partial [Dimargaris cristalligena]